MTTKPVDPQSPHLDSAQLAARWHCSVDRIYKMRSNGDGPKFICPAARRYLYPLANIEEWESAHQQSFMPVKPRRRRKGKPKLKLA